MSIKQKLKLDQFSNFVVINEPEDYDTFEGYSNEYSKEHDGIFVFVESLDDMKEKIKEIINQKYLIENGYIYLAYPKKGNKRYDSYIHRDDIFPALDTKDGFVLGSDIKFAKVMSLDDTFTIMGLKRVGKSTKKSKASSQKVSDYENLVGDVEGLLKDHPEELKFYQSLTPGYRKDWARFIFSAKQQKTRDKRANQMVEVLSQGYKTMDLFRTGKK
ncbi:hypothetical protein E3U55_06450 [Filobacillus milosensis]|uniref:YdeI/OmpD-associated family protein n=1 Tax=Filobacillus milosensis TaxID=94137 RepID=A0A4Y8IN50_9BACI|nr:YdeI/OmpD-associated family protein [Filobacillus milosensis]TFB22875.1 hypothetical protein E3U55_06450 [Filobacillus milosensis]